MNILVLGGNGYLGNKIVDMLAASGNNVTATVRNSMQRKDNKKSVIIPADINAVETALQYEQYDMVINTVCNYGRSAALYGDIIKANLEFPVDVLDMAAAHNVKRYITMGTGLPDELNMYSFSKKILNEFGRFYTEKQGMDYISLNLEMFYGADEPENRFLPGIIRKMIRGEDVNVTLGTQKRDIIKADDVVNAVQSIAFNKEIKGYKEIAVGTGEGPTISEIVDYLWEISGRRSVVNKGAIPMRDNEPDSVADVTEIKKLVEWEPVKWKQGLKDMYETINKNIN